MDKCIVWGMGNDYEQIINQIKFEELKGNIKIVALVAKENEIFASKRDGYSVISKFGLVNKEYNTVIISSSKYYSEILSEISKLGITNKKIVNGKIFGYPLFDYDRYRRLIEEPVTILSDDCWGGGISIMNYSCRLLLL